MHATCPIHLIQPDFVTSVFSEHQFEYFSVGLWRWCVTPELINCMDYFHHMYWNLTHYVSGTGSVAIFRLDYSSLIWIHRVIASRKFCIPRILSTFQGQLWRKITSKSLNYFREIVIYRYTLMSCYLSIYLECHVTYRYTLNVTLPI